MARQTAVYPCVMLALLAGVAGRNARILPPPEANTEPDIVLEAGYPGIPIHHLIVVRRKAVSCYGKRSAMHSCLLQ
jgi:hypothetical protein